MAGPDLNLLVALDVLLSEGSVAGAARRLRLSPSAMSRTLARLRDATGDPLLVRAGRGLVPTPRALELEKHVGGVLSEAQSVLRPADTLDPGTLVRTFTLRTSDGFVETFGASLLSATREQAPGVRLRFLQKPDRDSAPLREGSVDLETGVVGEDAGPEIRVQLLFRDRFIAVVRCGHDLAGGEVTAERYAAAGHVAILRRGAERGPVDAALAALGLEREIAASVAGFAAALALARGSDLVATVPERHTGTLRAGMHSFALPVETPGIAVSLFWHPRMDADQAHRWLRALVRTACQAA